MTLKNFVLYIILITIWTGCSKENLGNPIDYEVIFENHLSYTDEEIIREQYLVFYNEPEWRNFLPEIGRVNPSRADYLRDLEFEFNENILILIIGKYNNYCCSKININGVYKENGDVVVNYKESASGIAAAVSQAYTLLKISEEDAE